MAVPLDRTIREGDLVRIVDSTAQKSAMQLVMAVPSSFTQHSGSGLPSPVQVFIGEVLLTSNGVTFSVFKLMPTRFKMA